MLAPDKNLSAMRSGITDIEGKEHQYNHASLLDSSSNSEGVGFQAMLSRTSLSFAPVSH